MKTDYRLLCSQLKSICEGQDFYVTVLSNASALLYENLQNINWAGFYLMRNDRLALGPFQGKVACMTIEIGKGVCGTAVQEKKTLVVENVHEFQGHIACDGASNSEIVIPIQVHGNIIGVLDIDSPEYSRFQEEDQQGLWKFVEILEGALSACKME